MSAWTNIRRWAERALLLAGVFLVVIYLGALFHCAMGSRIALWGFEHSRKLTPGSGSASGIAPGGKVDFSLWAEKRVEAYQESLLTKFDAPLGVLRISRLQLLVPIFEGTDDLTLNRGVGRISGTALLGSKGNIGLAGHRDGFFRVLKDIQAGDSIEVLTGEDTVVYVVRDVEIVSPTDTRVLNPTGSPEVTLVTCYPFYFVGSAPERFIVHAFLASPNAADNRIISSTPEPASK